MAYYWVPQGAYDNCKDLPLNKCPITHLNHDTANRMWWAVRNHLGYKGENNTHGLYVLRHTVASRLVSLKGFNAHNPKVGGSNPSSATKCLISLSFKN